jgi:hypothetical protein
MAKKNTAPEASTNTPPTEADTTAKAAKAPGRPKGFSTKDGDMFKSNLPQPDVKVAPQAKAIAVIVEAAGTKGITRKDLVANMEGIVQSRQPLGRIVSYYQKLLVDSGFFTVTEAPAETAANTEA